MPQARRYSERASSGPSTVTTAYRLRTIEIRWCRPEDRQVVLSFLAETGFFRPDEIDIARELIDSGDRRRAQGTLPILRRSRERHRNRRLGLLGPDALHAGHVRHLLDRRGSRTCRAGASAGL